MISVKIITDLLTELNCNTSMNKYEHKGNQQSFQKKGACFCLLFSFTRLRNSNTVAFFCKFYMQL